MTKAEYLEDLASRRKFVQVLLSTGFGAMFLSFAYPVLRFIVPPKAGEPRVASAEIPWKAGELKANSGRIFKFGSRPGILVKTPAGELRAFTAICTHLACTVQYREEKQDIWCACHNGVYDLNGKNVSGPPPRPLDPYKVQVAADGKILVSKA
jgi:Rieske Fe-S protein